ncbi:MAG TPA: dTDP-4-dehydrorhamnose reductase, partial [Chloroflexota bacterium]|nr:dTDP-4-dehydrorhamnose reductase [Chloroflexota bacterium]
AAKPRSWLSSAVLTGSEEGMERTIAILGANGQLGSALVQEFGEAKGWIVQPLSHADLEIADRDSIARTLERAPDVFVNTAFWANEEPEPAFRVNAVGPRLLAEHLAPRGTRLVQISTDYVFSGDAQRPYQEDDRAEPRSIYGISKLAGESAVRSTIANHLIVRVSSLYGHGGSRAKGGTNFVTDMLSMYRQQRPIRVVIDQFHSPTYAPDAASAIRALLERDATGVVHVSNTGWCSKHEFAQAIFRFAGLSADVEPIRLADLPPMPPRPPYTVLAHDALRRNGIPPLRAWDEALGEYVRSLT